MLLLILLPIVASAQKRDTITAYKERFVIVDSVVRGKKMYKIVNQNTNRWRWIFAYQLRDTGKMIKK